MHREVSITVPAEATDELIAELTDMDGVISLALHRGESVKPPGDVVHAAVLNDSIEEVLRRVEARHDQGPLSISSSQLQSLVDTEQPERVRRDVDEVPWEDAETALRHHSRPTLNFFLTLGLGGVVAACALVSHSGVTEATALVAARSSPRCSSRWRACRWPPSCAAPTCCARGRARCCSPW